MYTSITHYVMEKKFATLTYTDNIFSYAYFFFFFIYPPLPFTFIFFFLNDPPPTEISPLPLHDALPISGARGAESLDGAAVAVRAPNRELAVQEPEAPGRMAATAPHLELEPIVTARRGVAAWEHAVPPQPVGRVGQLVPLGPGVRDAPASDDRHLHVHGAAGAEAVAQGDVAVGGHERL